MMEDRLTTLEVTSDSNTAAIAALENEMNDRFNRIETELSELRQNKADNDSTLYRLTNLQDEMNRRFGEVKDEMRRSFSEVKEEAQRRSAELRGACKNFCVKRGHEIIPKGICHDRYDDHEKAAQKERTIPIPS